MKVIEQHSTPDGLLKFVVKDFGDDIALGFDGFPWHTHPECIPPYNSTDWKPALRKYVDELLADHLVIGMRKIDGNLADAWVEEAPKLDKYKPANEVIEYRYWSGRVRKNPFN
jgi:hypothetical protein